MSSTNRSWSSIALASTYSFLTTLGEGKGTLGSSLLVQFDNDPTLKSADRRISELRLRALSL